MSNKHPDVVQIPKPFIDACPCFYDCVAGFGHSGDKFLWHCFHLAHDLYVHDLPGAKATKKKCKSRWLRFDPTHLNDFAELCDILLL